MADLSAFSRVEEYRQRALSDDPAAMTGSNGHRSTDFILSRVLERLSLAPGTVLVDVGSGDGTLIRLAFERCPGLRFAIGITPVIEERDRTSGLLAGLPQTVIRGRLHDTRLADACADVVVCNGVVVVAPPLDAALRELARIAKPGAKVFVGEVPDEPYETRRPNVLRVIASNFKHQGLRAGFGVIRYLLGAAIAGRWKDLTAKQAVWIKPEEFAPLARACGFSSVKHWQHLQLDPAGNVVPTKPDHIDYLLFC